jgi:hypothetical protein
MYNEKPAPLRRTGRSTTAALARAHQVRGVAQRDDIVALSLDGERTLATQL